VSVGVAFLLAAPVMNPIVLATPLQRLVRPGGDRALRDYSGDGEER
jgi:hypothetical protein